MILLEQLKNLVFSQAKSHASPCKCLEIYFRETAPSALLWFYAMRSFALTSSLAFANAKKRRATA